MPNKEQHKWLVAYSKTLEEYQSDTHEMLCNSCAKCSLCGNGDGVPDCILCAEYIFSRKEPGLVGYFSCLNRKVRPVKSDTITNPKEKERLIEYHKRAIGYLMVMQRFSMKNFQKFLRKIDNEINEKIQ